jgi:hypothetical protein
MSKFEQLFLMCDKMGMSGMLTMWLSFFTTSFVVLLTDDQVGVKRDFTMLSQLVCCVNLGAMGYSVANNVPWAKTHFYTLHFDTFATLLAFAYFGGGDVLDSTTLGVWNTVQLVGTAMNAVFGVSALYMVANDYTGFREYLGPPELETEV